MILAAPITVEAARALYESAGSGHDFNHVWRVVLLAERIARAEDADLEIACTAAWLHDIGESSGRADHHLRGAAMAQELLADRSAGFVEAVAHAIEAHRFRVDPAPRTLEARVVSDADKLDAIGAVGVARAFAYAGARGTALWVAALDEIAQAGKPRLGAAVPGGVYTPVHEFVYKLDRIPERLYTSAARAIAVERQTFTRAFFQRLDEEARGEK